MHPIRNKEILIIAASAMMGLYAIWIIRRVHQGFDYLVPIWTGEKHERPKILFPGQNSLMQYLETKRFPTLNQTTDPKSTRVVAERSKLFFGQVLKATLIAKDYTNNTKPYGGDYFQAILRPVNSTRDGVSCTINDRLSGLYDVFCPCLWTGKSKLHVTLIHPSESVYYLIQNTNSTKNKVHFWATFKNSTGEQEKSDCAIDLDVKYNASQICDYSHSKDETWFCLKPPSGECNPISWISHSTHKVRIIANPEKNKFYDEKKNLRVDVENSVFVEVESDEPLSKVWTCGCSPSPEFEAGGHPEKATGLFYQGSWISFTNCKSRFSLDEFSSCLKDSKIYIIGDSTMRIIYEFMSRKLKATDKSDLPSEVWSRSREGYDKRFNISFHFRSHGHPLLHSGPPTSRRFVTETLNEVKNARRTIILFTMGLHFITYSPSVLIRRIRVIKRAFQDLLSRLPEVEIFIKGFHSHIQTKVVIPSDWLTYRYEIILRKEFEDMEGVRFISIWDVSNVLNNPSIHPKGEEELVFAGIIQSYLCA